MSADPDHDIAIMIILDDFGTWLYRSIFWHAHRSSPIPKYQSTEVTRQIYQNHVLNWVSL